MYSGTIWGCSSATSNYGNWALGNIALLPSKGESPNKNTAELPGEDRAESPSEVKK